MIGKCGISRNLCKTLGEESGFSDGSDLRREIQVIAGLLGNFTTNKLGWLRK